LLILEKFCSDILYSHKNGYRLIFPRLCVAPLKVKSMWQSSVFIEVYATYPIVREDKPVGDSNAFWW